jgi:hypothetical protein
LTGIDKFDIHLSQKDSALRSIQEESSRSTTTDADSIQTKNQQYEIGRDTFSFFDKFNMLEFKLDNNIITVMKPGNKDPLKFELHAYGNTQMILKETKAFLIDDKSMAECIHLTKYFGPYHITKTLENRFIFTKDGNSAVVSKYKW